VVKWVAGGGGDLGPGRIPELVDQVAGRTSGELVRRYADMVVAGPPLCVGYLPKCAGPERTALGAVLALNCPSVRDEPVWREPCAAWGATAATALPTGVAVPTLVLTGRFDPFAPSPSAVRGALTAAVPGAFFVEDPAGPHNVLGGDCMRSVRTAWLNGDVRRPPAKQSCLAERVPNFTP
jgi:pimeloyl-ACP methyl ester carboxylesterase